MPQKAHMEPYGGTLSKPIVDGIFEVVPQRGPHWAEPPPEVPEEAPQAPETAITPIFGTLEKYADKDWRNQSNGVLTLQQWEDDGRDFGIGIRRVNVAFACWLALGGKRWGRTYQSAENITGMSEGHLKHVMAVGKMMLRGKVILSHFLTFSHLLAVVYRDDDFTDEQRADVLEEAARKGLTAAATRKLLEAYSIIQSKPDPPEPAWNNGEGGHYGKKADDAAKISDDAARPVHTAKDYGEHVAARLPRRETKPVEAVAEDDDSDPFDENDYSAIDAAIPVGFVRLTPENWERVQGIAEAGKMTPSEYVNARLEYLFRDLDRRKASLKAEAGE